MKNFESNAPTVSGGLCVLVWINETKIAQQLQSNHKTHTMRKIYGFNFVMHNTNECVCSCSLLSVCLLVCFEGCNITMIGNGCFHHLFALATVLYSTVHNYTLDEPLRDTTIVTMINWFNVIAARLHIIVRCLCHFNHFVDIVYVYVCTHA